MMLLSFIEQGNLIHAGGDRRHRLQLQPPLVLPGNGGRCRSSPAAKASGLWRCPSDTGPPDILPALAVGQGASRATTTSATASTTRRPPSRKPAPRWALAATPPIPATERGAFGVNINTRIRDVTDGTQSTMMMGEAANGAYTGDPEMDRLQLPLLHRGLHQFRAVLRG